MTHLDKLKKELEGVYKYAPQVIDITELHRKTYHYSTRKLIIPICEVIENFPSILIEEALIKFKAKVPLPHPNYFKSICINLMNENGNSFSLGKTI